MPTTALAQSLALLYFIPYQANFGDELNVLLTKRMLELENIPRQVTFVNTAIQTAPEGALKFALLGSILHHTALVGADIIGIGVNPHYSHLGEPGRVLATRGPLTTRYLRDHLGLTGPDPVHGDPALLIPRLFPEWLEKVDGGGVGLIPHFNDIGHIDKYTDMLRREGVEVCKPNQSAPTVIDFIRRKDTIVSSSLHGIIVSEMLGKTAKWVQYEGSAKSEGWFKYRDYYECTGRANVRPSNTVAEALATVLPGPQYDSAPLYSLLRAYLSSPIETRDAAVFGDPGDSVYRV